MMWRAGALGLCFIADRGSCRHSLDGVQKPRSVVAHWAAWADRFISLMACVLARVPVSPSGDLDRREGTVQPSKVNPALKLMMSILKIVLSHFLFLLIFFF